MGTGFEMGGTQHKEQLKTTVIPESHIASSVETLSWVVLYANQAIFNGTQPPIYLHNPHDSCYHPRQYFDSCEWPQELNKSKRTCPRIEIQAV
ncbi:hypothetical protein C5167_041555 [Papaver somniferum]|nr:hypothetical protein C5167_041555 [Papaver somniferum]